MKKITYLLFLSLMISFGSCADKKKKEQEKEVKTEEKTELSPEERARKIHDNVITIDTHVDIDVKTFTEENNYSQDLPIQVDLPKMREGGLDVVFLIVYTGQGELNEAGYKEAYANADAKFKAIHRLVEEIAPDEIELATTSDDVRRIVESGKKVAMIGVENAYPIGEDISKIEEFYNRGARYLSVAHNGHSQLGDSNTGERDDVWLHDGLSDLGREAIAEMNRLGIMVDLSHPSQGSNKEAIELSKAPVIASHSSARAVNDVSRNLYDDELKAVKENGGVVQAVAFASYIDSKKHEKYQKEAQKVIDSMAKASDFKLLNWGEVNKLSDKEAVDYAKKRQKLMEEVQPVIEKKVHPIAPPVDVKDFVDHIDHMVDLIGIDHVGISSDFDGGGGIYGWNDASETFNVTLELVKRDYSEEDIKKLWGENLLRVLDEVQEVAEKIQKENK